MNCSSLFITKEPQLCGLKATPHTLILSINFIATPLTITTPFRPIGNCLGEITPEMVVWLSSIEEKDLRNCGKFTLVGDMPTDIVKVDLSTMNTLKGSLDYFANCKAITSFNMAGCKWLTGNRFHTRVTHFHIKVRSVKCWASI